MDIASILLIIAVMQLSDAMNQYRTTKRIIELENKVQ